MKITLKVTHIDGDAYQVTTNLFTIVAMERKFKIKASDLATGIAMEQLAFLAFESCKQSGAAIVPVAFDDYIKLIESIDVVSDEPTNPTLEAPTPDL
jgi:hypothetical protein